MCLTTANVSLSKTTIGAKLKKAEQKRKAACDALKQERKKITKELNKVQGKYCKINREISKLNNASYNTQIPYKERQGMLKTVEKQFIKISKKDVICYKRFSPSNKPGYLETPFRHFDWPIGKVVKVKSFGTAVDADGTKQVYLTVNRGLHAYTLEKNGRIPSSNGNDIYEKMIIPAGTPHMYNHGRSEVVALAMRTVRNAPGVTTGIIAKG